MPKRVIRYLNVVAHYIEFSMHKYIQDPDFSHTHARTHKRSSLAKIYHHADVIEYAGMITNMIDPPLTNIFLPVSNGELYRDSLH